MCGLLGACMVAGRHAWLLGGMHGCQGMCMVVRSVHGCRRGACVVVGGTCMVAEGWHAWFLGGMCGCGGHVWLGGVCGWGHAWLLEACIGYDEIWSMSVLYASYWNAFLLYYNYYILYYAFVLQVCYCINPYRANQFFKFLR